MLFFDIGGPISSFPSLLHHLANQERTPKKSATYQRPHRVVKLQASAVQHAGTPCVVNTAGGRPRSNTLGPPDVVNTAGGRPRSSQHTMALFLPLKRAVTLLRTAIHIHVTISEPPVAPSRPFASAAPSTRHRPAPRGGYNTFARLLTAPPRRPGHGNSGRSQVPPTAASRAA